MIRALAMCATLSGCSVFAPVQPPAQVVCPAATMAKCDTSDPELGAELSADGAADLALFFRSQRNECAVLNDGKLDCLNPNNKQRKLTK